MDIFAPAQEAMDVPRSARRPIESPVAIWKEWLQLRRFGVFSCLLARALCDKRVPPNVPYF